MYYDKTGKKIGLKKWAELLSQPEYKIIKQDTLRTGFFVSTVWLGLNHNFNNKEKPLIFETMVFPRKGNFEDIDMDRYSCLIEALNGHNNMVKKWSSFRFIIKRVISNIWNKIL